MLTCLVTVLVTFYIQSVLKFKKNNNSGAAQSYRLRTVSEAHQLGVAGGYNSTALTTLLADAVHSCSRQGVVAARLTWERPGSCMSLSQTFTPLGVYSQYQCVSKFLKGTEVQYCVPNASPSY